MDYLEKKWAEFQKENFKFNKNQLKKIEEEFVQSEKNLIEIFEDFADDCSIERDLFCENLDKFDNHKRSSSNMTGSDDIQALCMCLVLNMQYADAREFKNNKINQVKKFIEENNKRAIFREFQSINRSAKTNLYISKNNKTFKQVYKDTALATANFFDVFGDFQRKLIPAGNRQKVRAKKQNN